MSGVATAIVGAAVVGGVASTVAANKAAGAQQKAADSANQVQWDMYNQSRDDQAPWRETGSNALNALAMRLGIAGYNDSLSNANLVDTSTGVPKPNADLYNSNADYRKAWDEVSAIHQSKYNTGYRSDSDPTSIENDVRARLQPAIDAQKKQMQSDPLYGSLLKTFSASDFQTDPGYAFRLSEGAKAVNNSAAARGGLLSGAAAKALTQYNQNFASNEYQNAFNRFNTNQTNQYNRLASLAGVGQTAANNDSTAALTTGSAVANNTLSAGNARASGYVGTANAVNNTITTGVNGYQGYQLTNALTRSNSSTGFNPTYQSSYSGFDVPSNYG